MSNETVLNELKKLLADKDRQITDLTALVAQQSDALANYFRTRCHGCNEEMDRTEIICAECHDPEPCIRDYKLHAASSQPEPRVPSLPLNHLPSAPILHTPVLGLATFELKRMPNGYFKDIGHNLCLRPDTNPAQPRFIALGYYVGDVIQPLTPELQKYCESMGIIYRPLDSYTILPSTEPAKPLVKTEPAKPLAKTEPAKPLASNGDEVEYMSDGYYRESKNNLCLRPANNIHESKYVAVGYYVGNVIQPLTPALQAYCDFKRINYCPLGSYTILPTPEKTDSSPIKVEDLKPLASPYLPSVPSGVPKLFTPKAVPELPKSTVREKLMLRKGPFGYLRDNKHNLCIKYVNDGPIVIGYYDAEDNIKPLTIELLKYCTENKLPYEPLVPEKVEEEKEEKKVRPVEPHEEQTFQHPSYVVVLKMTDGNYMAKEFRFAITADGGWASRNVFGCYDEDYVIRPLTSVEIAVCTKLGFTPILTMPSSQMVDL